MVVMTYFGYVEGVVKLYFMLACTFMVVTDWTRFLVLLVHVKCIVNELGWCIFFVHCIDYFMLTGWCMVGVICIDYCMLTGWCMFVTIYINFCHLVARACT